MSNNRFKALVAVHLFLTRGDEILLLRRFNTGYEDGNYSVVAGHLDGNEEVKTAMIREACEEAGITISPDDINVVGVMHRKADSERIDFFLTAKEWKGDVKNMEPDKCDDLSWFDINHLPDNTIPYVRKAIHNYMNGIYFDSFGWDTEK